MYTIYQITSPSGRSYIGLTKMKLRDRWQKHVRRASDSPKNHPFYNAIRKHGADAFTVQVIDTAPDKPAAQQLERWHIANHCGAKLYNVSPGGEADGETGARIFWDSINTDPEARAKYLQKLSEAKKSNDWTDYDQMTARAQEWRSENPKDAYKVSYRASRIARQGRESIKIDDRPMKEKLMWKHKRSTKTQQNALELWRKRNESERNAIFQAIADKAKDRWAAVEDPEKRSSMTSAARAAIDRKKQGQAASKGLKQFWVNLKADPVRYAEYMQRRTKSLLNTVAV